MGVSLAIHHYPFKLAHDSLWPPYKMEAFCLRHHPFTTSHFLERSMTYPARLQKTYWLPFVRTNITLWRGFLNEGIIHQSVLGIDAPLEEYLCYSPGSANLRKSRRLWGFPSDTSVMCQMHLMRTRGCALSHLRVRC